jgi:hypothetical protein
MKGIFEFEVSGEKRGFKFGTYGLSVACDKEDCAVDELMKRCGIPYLKDGKTAQDKPKLRSLLHLFYGAAVHYAEDNNLSTNFKPSTVSNWLDEIGIENVNKMMSQGLTQHVPKNSTSPVTETGVQVTP